MALRSQQDSNSFSFTDVSRDLLRVGGRYSPISASYYMVRILISGTVSSACMGLAGAGIGAYFFGTAVLPFLVCACRGFVFGAIGFYRTSLMQSMVMLDRHPQLLQLHLDAKFPARNFMAWRIDQMRAAVFAGSWVLRSMPMVAGLTAQPAIDQIYENREQLLVEEARAELLASASEN